jgi:hypothetical protein
MTIEVPDDLSQFSPKQLQQLEERIDTARTAVRVELRLADRGGVRADRYANRPRWAQVLGSLIDGPAKKNADRYILAFAILVVLMFTLPSILNSLIEFGGRYQASHYHGVPKSEPTAATLEVERQ